MPDDIKFWRYSITPEDSIEGWGIFILDSTGMFAAVTDYGNYAYRWSSTGCKDFREFVIGLAKSPYYLLTKVAPNEKVYDGNGTKEDIKDCILRYRRKGDYPKDFARKEWDLLKELDDEMDYDYGFYKWYEETTIEDASEFYIKKYPADCVAFAEKLIPRLAEVIKQELGGAVSG